MQVRNHIATLLVGLIALLSPVLVIAPAQAGQPIPTDTGGIVGTEQHAIDRVYRGYISCSGGPSSWCWGSVFYQVSSCTTGQYGCFYMSSRYWRLRNTTINYDNGTRASCVMGLAGASLGFFTGPWWAAVVGGSLALYGCQGVSP